MIGVCIDTATCYLIPAGFAKHNLYDSLARMAIKFEIPQDPNREYFFTADGLQSRAIVRGFEAKETFNSIPTIDVSSIISETLEDRKNLAEQINRAATDVGFMYLENPPVDYKLMGMSIVAPTCLSIRHFSLCFLSRNQSFC